MSNPARVVVLAEDARQQRFALRYLERLHYSVHDIRFTPLPSGRGSGEQWVRRRYADTVRDHRQRAARSEKALVMLIDADAGTVAGHQAELQSELAAAGLDRRKDAERIVHLIPKWSIETWILCLNGRELDEDRSYRNEKIDGREITSAANTFFDWSRPNFTVPRQCVPSLTAAFPEVRRLD